ncbi:hypothetical protein [Pseudotabrizicola sediminis]|uniref:hypothetical protein n=1 Tax=Pseudotabrizicola sediminis TaxID=2486418 RepID=UPI00108082E6|nr:hypothetical protein [Pseudotabrizicola sediminis]
MAGVARLAAVSPMTVCRAFKADSSHAAIMILDVLEGKHDADVKIDTSPMLMIRRSNHGVTSSGHRAWMKPKRRPASGR